MIPGQIETYDIIMDCAELSPWDVNLKVGKKLSDIVSEYFATTGKIHFVLNLPCMMTLVYNMAYYFLLEFTRSIIVLVSYKQIQDGFLVKYSTRTIY